MNTRFLFDPGLRRAWDLLCLIALPVFAAERPIPRAFGPHVGLKPSDFAAAKSFRRGAESSHDRERGASDGSSRVSHASLSVIDLD